MGMRAGLWLLIAVVAGGAGRAENWPCWRGARQDGTCTETNIPTRWSATENVLWKTELPGGGHASPIVWGDKIFTISAIPEAEERNLSCFDRKSGAMLWQRTVVKTPAEGKHSLNSFASSTPATDGELVYATFLDKREMVAAAYDFFGQAALARATGSILEHAWVLQFATSIQRQGDHQRGSRWRFLHCGSEPG